MFVTKSVRTLYMFKRTKLACYTAGVSMATVVNLPPLLFITFRESYGISYSLLGLLVLVNFCTQLAVDLIFSFFSQKFNIKLTVKSIPIVTTLGLVVFAAAPFVFGNSVYWGLIIGTVIFSAAGGLSEVLLSPVIAAIPAKNPEREMSKLHSVYGWGVVSIIMFSTLFLLIFGRESWWVLTLVLTLIPITCAILFFGAKFPDIAVGGGDNGILKHLKNRGLWICVLAIFLGGATECTMSQWSSGYLENALGIPKVFGDIFGVALFGLTLGLGRTLYAKRGKNIERVLLLGSVGAAICYLTAVFSPFPIISLVACALTGFCASMLWPGSLIIADKKIPNAGIFIYALMASGGDLGASVVPQLVGIVTDKVAVSNLARSLGSALSLSPEQVGMRFGMLIAAIFPIAAIIVFSHLLKTGKRKDDENEGQHS